jgi:dual specificity phosphatase 12
MGWKNVNAIIEGKLFLGNLNAARSSRSLSERRITHIVSVCSDHIPGELPESGMTHMRIPVEDVDYADLLIYLPAAMRFIHKALSEHGVVLVHCVQGLSRSATVVAAYRQPSFRVSKQTSQPLLIVMWSRRMNATAALEIIRRAREQVWPNPGFQEQLILFELCQYSPSPACGIYRSWRSKIDRRLKEQQYGYPS